MRTALGVIFIAITVAVPCVAPATTIRVPDDHATVAEALAVADSGDTVLVAPGTYTGPGNRDLSFAGEDIVLVSEAGAEVTIFDCEHERPWFYIGNGESPAAIIDGFTITGGYAVNGGGVFCTSSAPTIRNCIFSGNGALGVGGGINGCYSSLTLEDCVFFGNGASMGAGAALGGGSPTVIDCDFIYNHGNAGGGVGLEEDCSAVISGCTFDENEAFNGGGICCASSSPQIIGCTFARNYGTNGGAIICADGSSPAISNCILAHSVSGGAVHCGMSDEPEITHCAAFGNAGGDSLCGTYHDNLFVDPLFCNMGQGDLALCANSQCLPGGNSWGELIGAREQGCDDCSSSPVKDESWGSIKAMYR